MINMKVDKISIVNSKTFIPRSSERFRARRADSEQIRLICSCPTQKRSRAFPSSNSARELL